MKSGAYLVPLAFDSLFNGFRASFGSIILRLSRGSNRPLHNPGGGIHRNHRNLQNENKTGYSPYTPGLINCHTNQVSTRRLLLTNVTWLNLKPPPPQTPDDKPPQCGWDGIPPQCWQAARPYFRLGHSRIVQWPGL